MPNSNDTIPLVLLGMSAFLLSAGEPGRTSTIVDAAKARDARLLRDLLKTKINVNASAADGSTALHWATYHDDLESVDLLARQGANVNAATDLGVTALWTAGLNGNTAIVQRLLKAGADPNSALLSGETPLMVAARSGYSEIVGLLCSKGANVNTRATRGQTALMWAVAQKHPQVVKVLLANGADVHMRSEVWSQMMAVPPHGYPPYNRLIPHGGETALLFAARVGDLQSAKLLLEAGAGVNDQDAWGVSATVLAAHSGYTDMVELLLAKGADANASAAGFAAIHEAILWRDEKMVGLLLEHGANPNLALRVWTPTRRSSRDRNFPPALVGATPFWLAARFLQPNVMRLLAKHGADPRFVHRSEFIVGEDFKPRTEVTSAVMAAMRMGGGGTGWVQPPADQLERLTLETVKVATELGVPTNTANTDGRTALDAAKALRYDSVIAFLAHSGATQH